MALLTSRNGLNVAVQSYPRGLTAILWPFELDAAVDFEIESVSVYFWNPTLSFVSAGPYVMFQRTASTHVYLDVSGCPKMNMIRWWYYEICIRECSNAAQQYLQSHEHKVKAELMKAYAI
jgi:hypothetical protein